MNTIQGYDLIDGNCEPCRDRDKCQFLNKDICELTAQSLIRPMSGPYCKIEGQNGNTFYVQLGDTYKYIINTPTLGAMCVAQVCGGGREYCNEYSFADPDAVLVQLNSSLNSKIITTAQSLSDDFDVYGMAFKYIDPLDLQSLEITKNTLSALPPNMYIGMTLVFYDAQRSTNDGFADLVGKKAYVVATCNENEDCSVNATTIVHELTHLHQHEEYISSYCESENKFCSLLDAYNSAREKNNVLRRIRSFIGRKTFEPEELDAYLSYDFEPLVAKRKHVDVDVFIKTLRRYQVAYMLYSTKDKETVYQRVPGHVMFENEEYVIKKL